MKTAFIALALTFAAAPAFADTVSDRVEGLARAWDHVNYEVPAATRRAEMQKLADQADAVVAQNPTRAEPLVWDAIITASEGGLKGGPSGLGLASKARDMLIKAESLNPNVLDGSVYTTLGSLYSQVPGFPVGFGDKTKARSYLQKAVAASPAGIDSNFFMGDFLIRQHDYAGAIKALEKALAAPARPGRDAGDRGRRAEVQALLTDARKKAG